MPSSSGSCSIEGEAVHLFTFPSETDADLCFEAGKMETVTTGAAPTGWL